MKPKSPEPLPRGNPAGKPSENAHSAPTEVKDGRINGRFAKGNTIGHNANRAGRPKGARSLNDALRRRLQRPMTRAELERLVVTHDLPKELADELFMAEDRMEVLAELVIHKAMGGNMATFQEIFDRLAPKKAALELSGGPAPVRVVAAGQGGDEAQAADAYFTEMRGEGEDLH